MDVAPAKLIVTRPVTNPVAETSSVAKLPLAVSAYSPFELVVVEAPDSTTRTVAPESGFPVLVSLTTPVMETAGGAVITVVRDVTGIVVNAVPLYFNPIA